MDDLLELVFEIFWEIIDVLFVHKRKKDKSPKKDDALK